MSIWKSCHLKCHLKERFPMFYSFKLCRRHLHNRSSEKRFRAYIRLTCRPSTLKMINTSTASTKRNIKRRSRAIYYRYNNTRSCGRILFVCLLIFLHRILQIKIRVLFVQALQTSSKTNAPEYTTAKFKTLATTVWKRC